MAGLRLVAELGGDGSGFERMMSKAGMTAKGFGSGVISPLKNLIAGAFTVGAITQLTRSTVDWASKLRDTADILGVNVEWLQKMQNGAKLVGSDIEDVGKFINEMNRARQEALENPKSRDAQAMQRMGFSGAEIQNLSTQAFFEKIVAAFKNGATTQLVNDVQEVGGRSARNLIGAFSSQFQSDIPILSEFMIDELDNMGDKFTSLGQMLKVTLGPAIVFAGEKLVEFVNILKQMAAFAGGFSGKEGGESLKKNWKMLIPGGQAKALLDMLSENTSGGQAALEEERKQQKEQKAISDGQEAARKARKARENAPPQFDPMLEAKAGKRSSPDSLVKVGNFLGQAPGAINSIAEKQVALGQQQLATQKLMEATLRDIAIKLATNRGSSIGVPLI